MIGDTKDLKTGLAAFQNYNFSKCRAQIWKCFAIPVYESQPVQDVIVSVQTQAEQKLKEKVTQKAAEWFTADGLKTFMTAIGVAEPNADLTAVISLETEAAQRELLKRVSKLPEVIAPPTGDFETAINEKLTIISDLAFKMTLTQLILPGKFHAIYQEAQEKAKTGADLDTAFLKALDDAFRTSKSTLSAKERLLYWFHLNISSMVIKFYINGVMENFKKDLFAYLKRTPEERINDVFKVALGPLKEHMSAFYSYNRSLVNISIPTTIDKMNEQGLNKELPIDTYLLQFAEVLIDRYLPSISISNKVQKTLDKYMPEWSSIKGVVSAVKTGIVWASYLTTRLPVLALNASIKYGVKRELKTQIKLHLFTSENGAVKTHSRYQHMINQFIRDKLIQFNTQEGLANQVPLKLRSSPTTLKKMQEIVDELFRNIPLSIATNTPEALNKHFNSGNLQEGKQEAYTFFINQFTPDMSLELLKGMEHFFYDDKEEGKQLGLLSEVIWVTASNLIKAMKADPGTINSTDMNTTETDMHDQLHRAVNSVVRKGVKTALDPSKKLKNETTATIDALRKQSEAFLASIKILNVNNFLSIKNEWEILNKAVSDLEKQFQKSKVSKIQVYGGELLQIFRRSTDDLQDSINLIEKNQKTKAELQGQRDVLKNIGDQISAASAAEKIQKLKILRDKPWISDDFKKEIKAYEKYLGEFLETSSTPEVLRLEKSLSNKFAQDFENETTRINNRILKIQNFMQLVFKSLKFQYLILWTEKLVPIAITSEDVTNTLAKFIKVTNLPVDQYATPAVMYCVLELLNFKQKSYHWNGVLSRAIHAYTIA